MEARFGLVQDQERGWARRQQRGRRAGDSAACLPTVPRPRAGAEGSAGASAARNSHWHWRPKPPRPEGIGDRFTEGFAIADHPDRRERRREIRSVAGQDGRMRADLRPAGGCIAICAEMIVEPPAAHGLAQYEKFGRAQRVGAMRHHAVVGRELLGGLPPMARIGQDADQRPVAHGEGVRASEPFAGPLRLRLDLRIEREGTAFRDRKPEIDGIAVIGTRKAEPEADRPHTGRAFNRMSPRLIPFEMLSGPAHKVDCSPPSPASDWMIRPCAMSASRRRTR